MSNSIISGTDMPWAGGFSALRIIGVSSLIIVAVVEIVSATSTGHPQRPNTNDQTQMCQDL
jgi:hypothetical protein